MVQCLLQYIIFMTDACIVESAACSDTQFERNMGEARHPHGRRRSVADTHFAQRKHIATFGMTLTDYFRSALDTQIHFFFCHGCLVQIVTRAFAYLHVDDSFLVWEVVIHSGIYNLQLESVLAAKEVDTRPSVKKVADLLPGDLFGREADSLVDNAMIGCEYDILRMSQLGSKCLLDKPDLQGQFFKCSQRAFGLGQIIYFVGQCFPDGFVRSGDLKCFHFIRVILSFTFRLLLSQESPIPLVLPDWPGRLYTGSSILACQ